MEDFNPFYLNNVNTEGGQSSGLNRGDDEPIGEPSKRMPQDIPIPNEDEQVLEDEDHIIDDVEVDMESFKRNFANVPDNEAYHDAHFDLDVFDSASEEDGDYEAARNSALRKLGKQKSLSEVSKEGFYV